MYNDETILTFGKYKFIKLKRVPAEYLLAIYNNKSSDNNDLNNYIEHNLEKIFNKKNGVIKYPEIEMTCQKITYPNEKEAKFRLSNISKIIQSNKKPIRAYECTKCGGWHLTSVLIYNS